MNLENPRFGFQLSNFTLIPFIFFLSFFSYFLMSDKTSVQSYNLRVNHQLYPFYYFLEVLKEKPVMFLISNNIIWHQMYLLWPIYFMVLEFMSIFTYETPH